jgi:hypothetical protein
MKLDGADVVASIRNEGNIIDVDFGVVVPGIADHRGTTINGVKVDAVTEIIKGKYTKIMVRFSLEKEDILDKRGIKNIIFEVVNNK